jgi:hypothetical protein
MTLSQNYQKEYIHKLCDELGIDLYYNHQQNTVVFVKRPDWSLNSEEIELAMAIDFCFGPVRDKMEMSTELVRTLVGNQSLFGFLCQQFGLE